MIAEQRVERQAIDGHPQQQHHKMGDGIHQSDIRARIVNRRGSIPIHSEQTPYSIAYILQRVSVLDNVGALILVFADIFDVECRRGLQPQSEQDEHTLNEVELNGIDLDFG